jgi:hypothetical protein
MPPVLIACFAAYLELEPLQIFRHEQPLEVVRIGVTVEVGNDDFRPWRLPGHGLDFRGTEVYLDAL